MNILEHFDKPFEYASVLQTVTLAFAYGYLWCFATDQDAYRVYSFVVLMLFEFIMVHSGIFMVFLPPKYSIWLFFMIYGLFAWGLNASLRIGDNTILIIYLTTILTRMRFAFFNVNKQIKHRIILMSIFAASIYFILLMGSVFVNKILPPFALDETFSKSEAYLQVKTAEGLLIDKPYILIFMGFLYYSTISIVDFRLLQNKELVNRYFHSSEKQRKKKNN